MGEIDCEMAADDDICDPKRYLKRKT